MGSLFYYRSNLHSVWKVLGSTGLGIWGALDAVKEADNTKSEASFETITKAAALLHEIDETESYWDYLLVFSLSGKTEHMIDFYSVFESLDIVT